MTALSARWAPWWTRTRTARAATSTVATRRPRSRRTTVDRATVAGRRWFSTAPSLAADLSALPSSRKRNRALWHAVHPGRCASARATSSVVASPSCHAERISSHAPSHGMVPSFEEPCGGGRSRSRKTGTHGAQGAIDHPCNLLVREVLDLTKPERLTPLLGQRLERQEQLVGEGAVEDLP